MATKRETSVVPVNLEGIKDLVDELKNTAMDMNFVLKLITDISSYMEPKMNPTTKEIDVKPAAIESVICDIKMIYSVFSSFTPYVGGKLGLVNNKIDRLEDRIKELEEDGKVNSNTLLNTGKSMNFNTCSNTLNKGNSTLTTAEQEQNISLFGCRTESIEEKSKPNSNTFNDTGKPMNFNLFCSTSNKESIFHAPALLTAEQGQNTSLFGCRTEPIEEKSKTNHKTLTNTGKPMNYNLFDGTSKTKNVAQPSALTTTDKAQNKFASVYGAASTVAEPAKTTTTLLKSENFTLEGNVSNGWKNGFNFGGSRNMKPELISFGGPLNIKPETMSFGGSPNTKPEPMSFGGSPNTKPEAVSFGGPPNTKPEPMSFGGSPNTKPEVVSFGGSLKTKTELMSFGGSPNTKPEPMSFGGPPNSKPEPMSFGGSPNTKPEAVSFGGSPNTKPKPMCFGGSPNTKPKPICFDSGVENTCNRATLTKQTAQSTTSDSAVQLNTTLNSRTTESSQEVFTTHGSNNVEPNYTTIKTLVEESTAIHEKGKTRSEDNVSNCNLESAVPVFVGKAELETKEDTKLNSDLSLISSKTDSVLTKIPLSNVVLSREFDLDHLPDDRQDKISSSLKVISGQESTTDTEATKVSSSINNSSFPSEEIKTQASPSEAPTMIQRKHVTQSSVPTAFVKPRAASSSIVRETENLTSLRDAAESRRLPLVSTSVIENQRASEILESPYRAQTSSPSSPFNSPFLRPCLETPTCSEASYNSRGYSNSFSSRSSSLFSHDATPTTTLKYQKFISERMENKPVTSVGGVGAALGSRLRANGYTLATDLFEKFQEFDGNRESFMSWFKQTTGGNSRHANDCYNSLADYQF